MVISFTMFFLDQACQQIEPNQQCYTLDPKCVPTDEDHWNLYLSILLTVGVSVVLLGIFVLILYLVSRKSRKGTSMHKLCHCCK